MITFIAAACTMMRWAILLRITTVRYLNGKTNGFFDIKKINKALKKYTAKIENIRMVDGEYCLFVKRKGHSQPDEYVKLADNILKDILDYIGDRPSGYIFISTSNKNYGEGVTVLTIRRIIIRIIIYCFII